MMSLDHNHVPAGPQCHFKLALMMQEDVNGSPGSHVGPQPEGYMEGQMCAFVIRKVELVRRCMAKRPMKQSERGAMCSTITAQIKVIQVY